MDHTGSSTPLKKDDLYTEWIFFGAAQLTMLSIERNYLQEEQQRLLETRTVKEGLRTDAKNGFRKFNRIFFNVALQGLEKIV
ncbi:hypothetical protein [Aneurinibacillus aneurinilyticus]|uniref:Uncharacterized protein n=1 Tax=Aneurinibacillus aneurinilyticus TaxID=1391 RepID=A0A848D039_ANEAE|nr:hypothetical protein [Aneurinibacillus aneurinilyticus]NMF01016.1 hypothetical protein [Aneurinibacillus aneurinilyticus]